MAPAFPDRRWKPKVNPWLIASAVALAAFMEVLDSSIANVALPHIAGSLGRNRTFSTARPQTGQVIDVTGAYRPATVLEKTIRVLLPPRSISLSL